MTSNPLLLSGARELVSAVARRMGFAEEACGQMSLAVDEALCNVIRHGYQRETGRPIWISLWPMHEGNGPASGVGSVHDGPVSALKIVIEDEARQVEPSTIKSRDLEQVRPGGLGVHIIQAVMDEARYEKRERVGMRLTMVKRRDSSAAAPEGMGACCGGASCGTGSGKGPSGPASDAAMGAGHA